VNAFTFTGQIDSKGRITVPSRIRNRLNLENGDEISLSISSAEIIIEEVESYQEALELIELLGSVKSFSYSNGVVEVIVDE